MIPAQIVRLGAPARTALSAPDGRVIAVFVRSLYLQTAGGLVCIGSGVIGDGPLNALLSASIDWKAAGIAVGMRMQHRGDGIQLGRLTIGLSGAKTWRPPAGALTRFSSWPRGDGLARLLPSFARQRRIAGAIRLAGRMLGATAAGPADLLGLGPGLTPAGDDFLGGMMIAWRSTGAHVRADRLARAVQPLAAGRTSLISRAHLSAAAAGLGHAALHQVLRRPDAGNLRTLAAIGHTSGWDALAGAVAALAISRR